MKKKLLIFLAIIAITYFLLPKYAQKALIYLKPGIEDYKIFNNRKIAANDPQTWDFHYYYNHFNISADKELEFKKLETTSYLIIKDKKLLFEKYWNNYNDTTITNSFSVAKSIISLLIGSAIKNNYIRNVNQYIYEFIPEYNTKTNRNLQIKDLLTMSSGLNWEESYGGLFNNTTEAYYGKDLHSLISDLKVVETPGSKFDYLSGNTQILSEILKKATGMSVSEYAEKNLWKIINAEHFALWSLDKKGGEEKAYCCFNATARDFAKIGQIINNKGYWDSIQIIPNNYFNKIITPAKYSKKEYQEPFYSFHWWKLNYKNLDITYARGILGQYIICIPEKNMVVVRLGKKRSKTKIGQHPSCLFLYIDEALEMEKKVL